MILKNISKFYDQGRIKAVDDISLEVREGEFVSIMGVSGCGKSTLLCILGGMLKPDQGTVEIKGQDLYSSDTNAMRSTEIGFIFQQFYLIPYLNVLENILCPSMSVGIPNAKDKALGLIEKLQLTDRVYHKPGALSTGEQQRVAMARALIADPSIILADEPTGNLDAQNSSIVIQFLKEFTGKGGLVVMVTHDDRVSAQTDKVYSMVKGKLLL